MTTLSWQRISRLLCTPALLCGMAYGQSCEDFSLEAQPSSETAEPGKPFSIEVTLSNHSHETVTVFSAHMPSTWSVYEKSGSRWAFVWRAGIVRETPPASAENGPRKFPPEEYVKVAPGEVLRKKLDITQQLWGTKKTPPKYGTNQIRIFVMYNYDAPADEAQLNMLQCHLRTEPIEVSLITNKQAEHSKRSGGGGNPR